MDELNKNENESNDVIQSTPKHYLLGILGAIFGAFICSIPWLLMYVYGNMILSALAIIIAIGALKGYQIFKGTIDKKLPVIISVVSLLVIIVVTLAIIPMLLLIKDGYLPTISNFKLLYGNSEFSSAIVHDLMFSVAFTILGISGVVSNVNKKIKESDTPLDKIKISDTLSNNNSVVNTSNEQSIHTVKDVFMKYNAMDKSNAIDKNTLLAELQEIENGKQLFRTLKTQQIIKKYRGKYYFSEKAENSVGYRFILLFGKIMLFIVIVIVVLIAFFALDDDSSSTSKKSYTNKVNTTSSVKATKYDLPDVNMQIRVPVNMTFTTDKKDLVYLLGENADSFYKLALYNETDLISCFVKDTDSKTVDNYYESLKQSLSGSNYTIISDFKKETISGFEFTTIEAQTTSNGKSYNNLGLGYFADGKFVFFEYTFLSENASQARTIMNNIIKKMK